MTLGRNDAPSLRESQGSWGRAFSYHPFTPILERSEGAEWEEGLGVSVSK